MHPPAPAPAAVPEVVVPAPVEVPPVPAAPVVVPAALSAAAAPAGALPVEGGAAKADDGMGQVAGVISEEATEDGAPQEPPAQGGGDGEAVPAEPVGGE